MCRMRWIASWGSGRPVEGSVRVAMLIVVIGLRSRVPYYYLGEKR